MRSVNSVVNSSNKPDRKLRVGVTIHIRESQQTIWENGIYQNCVFLVQLLNLSPEIEKAVLVNGANAKRVHEGMMLHKAGVGIMGLDEAMQNLDVVIEMSQQLAEDWVSAFKARGGKLVWMRVGNDYVIDIERAMFDKPHASLCSDKPYDAVWTIPEYERSCVDYYSLTTRAPVSIVPHLWTPQFFQMGIDTLPTGISYGYKPGSSRWRVACFEPNLCMVKTSMIPMLVCEEAYRKNPKFLEFFRICNTIQIKENPVFVNFARSLDITNHGLATFEGRFAIYEYMAHFGDCIISHHWENGQNYLYYEALYGGYPLVHNSEFIKDYGYYYPEFDTQAGGRVLNEAFANHDQNLDSYRKSSLELLAQIDIQNPENIDAYSCEILRLFK